MMGKTLREDRFAGLGHVPIRHVNCKRFTHTNQTSFCEDEQFII